MPGLREEVHGAAEHGTVPVEKPLGLVEKILWLLALGVDASALEEVFGVREVTIRTWLCRSGMQGKKLHERFHGRIGADACAAGRVVGECKNGSQDMWLWVAHDAKTKLIPVLQVGEEVRRWPFRWCMNSKEGWQRVVCLYSARMDSNITFMP
jgi:hypothetical protein